MRAVVTDRKGQVVANLTQNDFEIMENGQPQSVSFFSLVGIQSGSSAPFTANRKSDDVPNQPNRPLAAKPARTIVLFVDTLHLSSVSLLRAKQQLKRFVDEQITEEDLVAVVTTSGELGLLQQFMRDRKMLKYAIDKITGFLRPTTLFTPYLAAKVLTENPPMPALPVVSGRQSSTRNPPPDLNQVLSGRQATAVAAAIMTGEDGVVAPSDAMVRAHAREVLGQESIFRKTTLQILKAVSERMAEMPGERLIAFMSDGFTLLDTGGGADNQDFNAATSRAVRSGAIVYSFSPAGLTTPVEFTAASPVHFNSAQPTLGAAFGSYMADSRMDQQGTLRNLAADTGGEVYLNSNDLAALFRKMTDANTVYYAMAYYPKNETDDRFRNLKVRVRNHPEYHVRAQRGYQLSKESKPEVATTPQQKLFQAMIAPLPVTMIGVTSSASFLERADDDAKVTLQIHFNGNLLEYPERDQKYLLNCEVAVVVLDRNGKVSQSSAENITAAFTPEQLENARQNGYRYSQRLNMPPGLYQIRIGVRDENGGLMGTSTSWVNVPDRGHKKLLLSDVFLGKAKPEDQSQIAAHSDKHASIALVIGPASFKTGEMILYRFVLYDAPSDRQAIAGLQLKVEVLQSGASVYEGPWQPLAPRMIRSDKLGTEIGGQLKMEMPPGIYTLRVSVKGAASNGTTQATIDLELAP